MGKLYFLFFFILSCIIFGFTKSFNVLVILASLWLISFGIKGLLKGRRLKDSMAGPAGIYFIALALFILGLNFLGFSTSMTIVTILFAGTMVTFGIRSIFKAANLNDSSYIVSCIFYILAAIIALVFRFIVF